MLASQFKSSTAKHIRVNQLKLTDEVKQLKVGEKKHYIRKNNNANENDFSQRNESQKLPLSAEIKKILWTLGSSISRENILQKGM